MPSDGTWGPIASCLALTGSVVAALRKVVTQDQLANLMKGITAEMGFRHYALVHHEDLRASRPGCVDIKDYPSAIIEHLVSQRRYRRDPVIRGCIFAGTCRPQRAQLFLGAAQMIGIFAFQAARRLLCGELPIVPHPPRLHPRPRDCLVLLGRGYSNKRIARALSLTPRTVDGYLTEARRLFDAHDRTELVVSAILSGEIGLDELKACQPE
jgi:DNA-binding CsgD family transcriptional regulator